MNDPDSKLMSLSWLADKVIDFFTFPKYYIEEYYNGKQTVYYVQVKEALLARRKYLEKQEIINFTFFALYYDKDYATVFPTFEEAERVMREYIAKKRKIKKS